MKVFMLLALIEHTLFTKLSERVAYACAAAAASPVFERRHK
jgi:hypothetical protein